MPPITDGGSTNGGNGIAAALVGVGQGLMLGRNGDGGATIVSSTSAVDGLPDLSGRDFQEQLDILNGRLEVENRIRDGAENLLQVFETEHPEGKDGLRRQVESELSAAKIKISNIKKKIEQLREAPGSTKVLRKKPLGSLHTNGNPPASVRRLATYASQSNLTNGKAKVDNVDKDDFKTALTQARSLVHLLSSYIPHNLHSPSPFPYPSSSPGASSSSPSNAAHSPPKNLIHDPTFDLDRSRIDTLNNIVNILQRNVRVGYELDVPEVIQAVLPSLADHSSKEARAAAYRLIRHVVQDPEVAESILEQGLDLYLIRTLSRDNKHGIEKEQALKLIRSFVTLGSQRCSPSAAAGSNVGCVPLTESVMRAILAVAEYGEDPFRLVCMMTLTEIVLVDIDLVARSGGMRVLLQVLADGPPELAPVITMAFLYIVDAPRTRAYLNPGSDLEIALSGFTDAYGKGFGSSEHMRTTSRVVSVMLRTWSGLMYLCLNDMHAISSLIDTLRIPSLETREVIVDMFFDVLNIKTPDWYQAFLDGRRLTMYRRQQKTPTTKTKNTDPTKEATLNLTDQYIALLLLVFVKAGLLDALVGILEESTSDSNVPRKATLLIGEILHISARVLPLAVAAKIQALPRLFSLAADYGPSDTRQLASNAFSSIDSFNRNRARLQVIPTSDTRKRANSTEDPMRRGQRQVEQVKIKMGMQIDDRGFQALLIETQVMLTKDHTKWNFEVLTDLVESSLLNPKRLEEAFRVSKFGRRLMSFFHPFNNRFAAIKQTKPNQRYVRLGCALLTTLIKSPEGQGVRFLAAEDALLPQLAECFNQLDPFNGTPSSDPVFSKEKVDDTLTAGYFEMLGTLSKYPEGIELMERFRFFTLFYHISELRSREDLVKGIIENVDYTIDGHPRIVLSKALTSSYKHIRLYATQHLGQLIRNTLKANEWTLRLLLTQLYDPAIEVAELAVHFLEDVCDGMDILELVVQMQPTLDHLGEIGHPLLLKFMSTSVGFQYLSNCGYIDREMDSWFHDRNYHYVVQMEVFLSKAFGPSLARNDDDMSFDGVALPHFYGELAKTPLGCQVLQERGHFAEFSHFIRQHGLEQEDFDIINKLKSVLWAVGNIGSTSGGLPFLEEEEIVPIIIEMAEQSPVLSVRGTCFFVLGLISNTQQGAEILDEYEWDSTLTPLGMPTGLCVPLDVSKFVYIPRWDKPSEAPIPPAPPKLSSQAERDVLTAISNLCNTVIANEAARTLAEFKARRRRLFSSIPLFCRVLHIISTQRYRLPVRRYILELFDVRLDLNVVQRIVAHRRSWKNDKSHDALESGVEDALSDGMGVSNSDRIMLTGGDHMDMDSYEDGYGRERAGQQPITPAVPLVKLEGFDV